MLLGVERFFHETPFSNGDGGLIKAEMFTVFTKVPRECFGKHRKGTTSDAAKSTCDTTESFTQKC